MLGRQNQTGAVKSERSNAGFSLIELLIVVAVILIIAAIAIPNFIRSKMMANEAAAVQNSRNVTTAEVVYSTTYGIGFSPNLTSLSGNSAVVDQNNAGLIDSVLAAGAKSGYSFTYSHPDARRPRACYRILAQRGSTDHQHRHASLLYGPDFRDPRE